MSWDAWAAVAVVAGNIALLLFTRFGTDLVLLAGVTLLVLLGVLSPAEALAGFANEGVATVGVLYVVVAGLEATGGVAYLSRALLGRPKTVTGAQLRLMLPVAFFSAFMNNTPLVAMMIPAVGDWARRLKISPSKLLMPLSHAAVLGGVVTVIGTSTNLVVSGLLREADLPPLRLFEQAPVGVVVTVVGLAYILLVSRWLLPARQPVVGALSDYKAYSLEMLVANGAVAGRTVEGAGLRHLDNLYLAGLERDGQSMIATPDTVLNTGDRLFFVGAVDAVVELTKFNGLLPAPDQVHKLDAPRAGRTLVEAVVSETSPLVGRSIREGRFRNRYDAVVIAASRGHERLSGKLGDVVLRPGDTLLLEARPAFVEQQRNSRDFYLVSAVQDSAPLRHERGLLALGILVGMVLLASFNLVPMFQAALLAAAAMLVTRCVSGARARSAVDGSVLVAIAASFALGKALEVSGAAAAIAGSLIRVARGDPWWSLVVVYLVTMIFTEMLSNNGAAALVFPIALATAANLGVNPLPFAIAIMIAASCAFATPIGYQTNLMVYGPGGYRFTDFTRMGLPLNFICMAVAVTMIPRLWPF